MLIVLYDARDILVQFIFPFRLNKRQPVLHCKNEMKVNLDVGIWHGKNN